MSSSLIAPTDKQTTLQSRSPLESVLICSHGRSFGTTRLRFYPRSLQSHSPHQSHPTIECGITRQEPRGSAFPGGSLGTRENPLPALIGRPLPEGEVTSLVHRDDAL